MIKHIKKNNSINKILMKIFMSAKIITTNKNILIINLINIIRTKNIKIINKTMNKSINKIIMIDINKNKNIV
jgi:hypothetical protein